MPEGLGGAGAPGGAGLPAGMPPLPPGMHSGSAGLPSGMPPAGLPGMPPAGASMSNPAALQQTRHARRIYVGNINNATEPDLLAFFNQIIEKAAGREFPGGAVASVYLNSERRFAFVELRTIELATACVTLDGIMYNGTSLKIKRPNDYNPTLVPPSGTSTIHLDLSKVPMAGPGAAVGQLAAQGISDRVPDGPGKIFVGGLPYELDEQALTPLLESFGKLRGLHLVREAGQTVNKGYAFCEYMDHSIMDAAIEGLNGLELAGRPLTVRRAQNQAQPQMASTAAGFGPGAGVGAPPPGIMSMGGLPGMPGSNPMAAASALASAQLPGAQCAWPALLTTSHASISPPLPSLPPYAAATRVLVLRDMLSKEDLENDEEFQDIEDDIRTEVSKFGNLTTLLIPRGGEPGEGRVFLEYDAPDAALAAAQQLEGRIFDNRTVKTEFMDEEKFKKREF